MAELQEQFLAYLGVAEGHTMQMLFRFGMAEPVGHSARRRVEDIIPVEREWGWTGVLPTAHLGAFLLRSPPAQWPRRKGDRIAKLRHCAGCKGAVWARCR